MIRGGHRGGIDQQRVGLDIGEDRLGALVQRRIGGGREGDGGHDHFVARAYADRPHGAMQGRGAGIDRDTLARADMGGKGLFEFGNPGPGGEPAGYQRLDHRLHVRVGDFLAAIRQESRLVAANFAIRHRPCCSKVCSPCASNCSGFLSLE